MSFEQLLTPLQLGPVEIRNRIVSTSHQTSLVAGSEIEQVARSTSKSAVSRAFVERTRDGLIELMARPLGDVRLAVLMLDGIELKERIHIVCLGITTEGVKIPLGLWEGSTENATVATALLADLVERGLDPQQGIVFVLDGGKALRKAIRPVFGHEAPVQRCSRHKERNVTDHLPERDRPALRRRLREAWDLDDHQGALARLEVLAAELEHVYPDAAKSLREGTDETLTMQRLRVRGALKRTLSSTNPIESMIEIVRKIIGYSDLASLVTRIDRSRTRRTQPNTGGAMLVPA